MGWTSQNASHYKNGKVDRKKECDAYFLEGLNRGYFEILKSAMVGSTYYATVRSLKRYSEKTCADGKRIIEDIPEEERRAFGVVILTQTNNRDYFNFSYKEMDESMGPAQDECPIGIINLLDDTDSEFALDWRKRCIANYERKKSPASLRNLPVGTSISYTAPNGVQRVLVKHAPAYQFKRPFWFCPDENCYISKKYIPNNYNVLT